MPQIIFTSNKIKQRLRPIFTSYKIRKAILFGSYSKGTAISIYGWIVTFVD